MCYSDIYRISIGEKYDIKITVENELCFQLQNPPPGYTLPNLGTRSSGDCGPLYIAPYLTVLILIMPVPLPLSSLSFTIVGNTETII